MGDPFRGVFTCVCSRNVSVSCSRLFHMLSKGVVPSQVVPGGAMSSSRVSCTPRLQNFFTHIRKLPHFDTRFGAAQARCGSPQKRVISICAGRSVGAFLTCTPQCQVWQFLSSKRVSKWGNFLISINFFCKRLVCRGSERFVST